MEPSCVIHAVPSTTVRMPTDGVQSHASCCRLSCMMAGLGFLLDQIWLCLNRWVREVCGLMVPLGNSHVWPTLISTWLRGQALACAHPLSSEDSERFSSLGVCTGMGKAYLVLSTAKHQ